MAPSPSIRWWENFVRRPVAISETQQGGTYFGDRFGGGHRPQVWHDFGELAGLMYVMTAQ